MFVQNPVVFIVDDDEEVTTSLKWMLEAEGFEIEAFNDGELFLKQTNFDRPCCLLLDVRMPKMTGIELQEKLLQRQVTIPIVFLTGHGDIPMTVRAMQKGAFDFLLKPINNQKLISTINKAIESDIENRIELYSSSDRKDQIKNALKFAIERDELYLVYQPIYVLKTQEIIGFETLIRWQHPEMGLIPPDEFIPVAEECGLITAITEWVLKMACESFTSWGLENNTDMFLSVNITTIDLESDGFVDMVAKLLEKTGVAPSQLKFELTETALMTQMEECKDTLIKLQDLGITISIDDFGTGYSSLGYLKNLPLDNIKVDRIFIRDIPKDEENAIIIRSVLTLARNLGLDVIVEGVEEKEQLNFLLKNDCYAGQGYYFCRPVEYETICNMLKNKGVNS